MLIGKIRTAHRTLEMFGIRAPQKNPWAGSPTSIRKTSSTYASLRLITLSKFGTPAPGFALTEAILTTGLSLRSHRSLTLMKTKTQTGKYAPNNSFKPKPLRSGNGVAG